MNRNENVDDLLYWARQMEETMAKLAVVRNHLYETACTEPLSVQEMYKLRENLMDADVRGRFLITAITSTVQDVERPLWKRLIRK